jgi:hypothetical protein
MVLENAKNVPKDAEMYSRTLGKDNGPIRHLLWGHRTKVGALGLFSTECLPIWKWFAIINCGKANRPEGAAAERIFYGGFYGAGK